jgi:nitroreductase
VDVLEAIHSRRSIGRLRPDVPPREVIQQMLAAAVQAPNHHLTLPWRFFVLTGAAREALGNVVAESIRPSLSSLDEERRESILANERVKTLRAPLLIVVGVKHDPEKKAIASEDLQACAAAIQNMQLAATALGLAATWRTGAGAYSDDVKRYFGLDPRDEIAGIVYLGYPDPEAVTAMQPRVRSFEDLTVWQNGSSS